MNVRCGDLVRDSVSGFEGIAIARYEYLNGCVRIAIQPRALHDGKPIEQCVFDIDQVEIVKAAAMRPAEKLVATGGPQPNPVRSTPPPR